MSTKAKTAIWLIGLLFNAIPIWADSIKGIVVCAEGDFPVHAANISIFNADSIVCSTSTDLEGRFSVSLLRGIYRVKVEKAKYYTLEDSLKIEADDQAREVKLTMRREPILLEEVVVKADQTYVRNLDDGIMYNLSRDKYAQKDNLLNALNRVPLIMVDNDKTITVAGKSSYVIYMNGKPYNIANADPAQVLRSIPSSEIKQIEVITRPAQRFGESAPVINIITKGKSIDGYNMNINGMGGTTPKAQGGASLLGTVNKVQFYGGYTYELWGQRDQQWKHEYDFGNGKRTYILSDKNHRDRHTHTGRALLEWDVDTLRQLYADFHINGIRRKERLYYEHGDLDDGTATSYKSVSDTWDASLETNVIYSSRFKNSKARKWKAGYRFTINPDNREYLIEDLSAGSATSSKTRGRLYTHNLQLYRRVNITKKLFTYLTLNANIRKGSSASEYGNLPEMDNDDGYHYTQILGSLNWSVIWYLAKKNDLWLNLANKLEYADDKSSEIDNHRQSVSYLPSMKLTWQPNWDNEFSVAFNSGITRPSLQMLNPFKGGEIGNDVSQGSPDLKNSRAYTLTLAYSYYGKKLSIHPSIIGCYARNAIMSVYGTDKTRSQLIETYDNVSRVRTLSCELFVSYRPWKWLTLRNVSSFGVHNISSDRMSLNQLDGFYRSTTAATFNLPAKWRINANFTFYKVEPQAWLTYRPGVLYDFSVTKTLLDGNMYVSVFADSPFNKQGRNDSRTILSTPDISYNKLWRTRVRAVGIEVSINLQGGKKVRLERDTSLKDTDIKTGIAD